MRPIPAGAFYVDIRFCSNVLLVRSTMPGAAFPPIRFPGAPIIIVMRERFPHLVRVTVLGEDLPEEENRVEIDPELKDSSGIPAPRVVYSYSENSLKMLEHSGRMAHQVLEAAGAKQVLDSGVIAPAFHLLGTARMGTDPKTSVVDACTAPTMSGICTLSTAAHFRPAPL